MFKNINHYKHKRKINVLKMKLENEILWVRKQRKEHTRNNTIRTRKSNIFYILYSIFFTKNKQKTHMHHTACTLVIQTNVQNELEKNHTRTYILMQKQKK